MVQRSLLYSPYGKVKTPESYGLDEFIEIDFTMPDNAQIKGWFFPPTLNNKILVYLHGNAGHMGHRSNRYKIFSDILDVGILALSYRGFPGSTGKPSEKKFYQDFSEIVRILNKEYRINTKDIIIYGASLGSGIAVDFASKHEIYALILESPFTNINDIAKLSYWFLPVDLMLKDRFTSKQKASKVISPTLIIHAEKDRVIPLRFGKELYEEFSDPKKFITHSEGGHVRLNYHIVAKEIQEFLREQASGY